MRLITMAIALAMFAVACGGSGTSGVGAARFCEIMEEFVTLANDAIAGAAEGETDDIETLTARVEELVTEAEAAAPEEISDIINSTDEADQDEITNYVSEECGVELPSF